MGARARFPPRPSSAPPHINHHAAPTHTICGTSSRPLSVPPRVIQARALAVIPRPPAPQHPPHAPGDGAAGISAALPGCQRPPPHRRAEQLEQVRHRDVGAVLRVLRGVREAFTHRCPRGWVVGAGDSQRNGASCATPSCTGRTLAAVPLSLRRSRKTVARGTRGATRTLDTATASPGTDSARIELVAVSPTPSLAPHIEKKCIRGDVRRSAASMQSVVFHFGWGVAGLENGPRERRACRACAWLSRKTRKGTKVDGDGKWWDVGMGSEAKRRE
ncbi:hypothetical protein B0H11DRAFT_1936825 [Mycena galericulata]|nr:hypothetical protein B0H11DRAFT_1936825 [Mycena galericulata]